MNKFNLAAWCKPGTVLTIHGHTMDCPDDCDDPRHTWSAAAVVLEDGLTAEYLDPIETRPIGKTLSGHSLAIEDLDGGAKYAAIEWVSEHGFAGCRIWQSPYDHQLRFEHPGSVAD